MYAQQLKLELLFKNAKGSSFGNTIWAHKFLVDILFVRDTLIAVFSLRAMNVKKKSREQITVSPDLYLFMNWVSAHFFLLGH